MYAKIINNETKEVVAVENATREFIEANGFTEMEVEQAYNGSWYVKGYAPEEPAPTEEEQRKNRELAYAQEVDPLHAQRQRRTILGTWSEEDEEEYILKVKELSDKIAKEYPYNEEVYESQI